jgi:uncharacterized iron-regulated protein
LQWGADLLKLGSVNGDFRVFMGQFGALNRWIAVMMVVVLACLPLACFDSERRQEDRALQLQDHQLAGKIWDVREARFIDRDQLMAELAAARYLLLGEIHDNIEHHRRQAQIIAGLSRAKIHAQVYFEMIDWRQGEKLRAAQISNADQLVELLEQDDAGWDYRNMYRDLFQQVLNVGYSVEAANLPRDQVRQAMTEGESDIADEVRQCMQAASLNDGQYQALKQEIMESHCNMMPPAMIEPMIFGQRLRDASMALQLFNARAPMKVLITGYGHARRDRGVPLYLRAQKVPPQQLIAVAMIEVDRDGLKPQHYAQRWEDSLPFDFIWFTARFDRPDPCEELRKRMKN